MSSTPEPHDEALRAARLGMQRFLAALLLGVMTPLGMGIVFAATPDEAPTFTRWILIAVPLGIGYAISAPLWRGPDADGTPSWRRAVKLSAVTLIVCGGTLAALVVRPSDTWIAGTVAAVCAGCAGIGVGGLMIGLLHAGFVRR